MKHLLLTLTAILLTISTFAQTKMELANQAFNEGDYASVIQYATDQLKQSPKDAEALAMRAVAFMATEDNTSAMADITAAIKYWNKKCPITLAKLYCLRGYIYESEEQYKSALEEYNLAVKKDSKNPAGYKSRAELYYKHQMYAEAEADYRKAYELEPTDSDLAVETARCLLQQGKKDDAAQILDRIIKYEPMQAEAIRLRAVMHYYDGNFTSAIDMYIAYLSLDHGDMDILLYASSSEYAYALKAVTNKLKSAQEDSDRFYWLGVRANIYQVKNQYDEALADLRAMKAYIPDTVFNTFITYQSARCYYFVYDFKKAVENYTLLIDYYRNAGVSVDEELSARGYCYERLGSYQEAIADYTEVINGNTDYSPLAYCRRSVCKHEMDEPVEASIEDLNKGLLLDENNISCLIMRGKYLLTEQHDTLRANRDFERLLQVDTVIGGGYTSRHFALMYLGRNDEAVEWLNKIIGNEPDAGNYYDGACLYARMNRPDEAMKYLKSALDMGYKDLRYIEIDDDLDSLRNRQDYKDLIAKYQKEKISNLFNKL